MSNIRYIEDLFLELSARIQNHAGYLTDYKVINDFEDSILKGKGFTKKQGDYAIKLLKKYANSFPYDITDLLNNPVWQNPFRQIDYTKRISIEKNAEGQRVLHIKFPFNLKEAYQKEFAGSIGRHGSNWSPDDRAQVADMFSMNLIQLFEFGKKYHFEFSDDFLEAVSLTEEYWSRENDHVPYAVFDQEVRLVNAPDSALNYFNENKTGNATQDFFLARSMGFPAMVTPSTEIEKIISSSETHFWMKDTSSALKMINELEKWPVVIILDRSSNVVDWTRRLVDDYKKLNLPLDQVRVCFRFKNDEPKNIEFNNWVKSNNLGGDVKTGKVFICQHKPPKWMLENEFDAKIIISNNLYPHTNNNTVSMIQTHHTVIYVGNIRPSPYKEKKIVEL